MTGILNSAGRVAGVAAAAFVLCVSASSDVASGERRITTEEEFRRVVVDRKHNASWGYTINRKDGTIRGFYKGKFVSGEWSWEGEYYCRDVMIDLKELGHDCQVVTVSGNRIVYTRKKGSGKTATFELE